MKHSSAFLRPENPLWYVSAMEYLVDVVQDMSHARDIQTVVNIVRTAARELTGADGATFVLRDEDKCFYVDEDAIAPLWKGGRFPISACISGWVMINASSVVIDDVFDDPRIPHDVYRATFVKSMAMVPIRMKNPVGAIGNYWAVKRHPGQREVAILQALANVTAVTLENIDLYEQLQTKLHALEISNDELNRFAWAASHDLKAPLRAIDNLAAWIEEDVSGSLSLSGRNYIQMMRGRVCRMEKLLTDILEFAQVERQMSRKDNDMATGAELVEDIKMIVDLGEGFHLGVTDDFLVARVPRKPMTRILINLVGNAIKHHDKEQGYIMLSVRNTPQGRVFSVADDGPGIPDMYHERVFAMFQTIQPRDAKEASGMGLSMVKKIVALYGGDVWVEKNVEKGTVISFAWPREIV
ncbi:MAG: ATP-binding protein [Pseudobdellovibrionaceae bacterium]